MNKQEFYQDGFYTLMGIIIGLVIGCMFFGKQNQYEPIREIRDTVRLKDTVLIEKHITLNERNLMLELQKQDVKYPNIVMAQAKHESNHFRSNLVKTHNNFLGIKRGKNYAKYTSWNECVVDYKKRVQCKYKGGDYYAFLQRIGYAEDPLYIQKIKKYV